MVQSNRETLKVLYDFLCVKEASGLSAFLLHFWVFTLWLPELKECTAATPRFLTLEMGRKIVIFSFHIFLLLTSYETCYYYQGQWWYSSTRVGGQRGGAPRFIQVFFYIWAIDIRRMDRILHTHLGVSGPDHQKVNLASVTKPRASYWRAAENSELIPTYPATFGK